MPDSSRPNESPDDGSPDDGAPTRDAPDHDVPDHDSTDPGLSSAMANLQRIFEQVAEAPRDDQQTLLDELCPDPIVKRQVRDLLTADATEDLLLDHSLLVDAQTEHLGVGSGEQIANYKLLEEIGQGGMGVVFMAEQFEPVHRKVALKVIKPGVDTREVIARFDAERQALSLMNHPNIATVLDAGATSTGRPYFVMELVQGQPITTYCDAKQLSATERLELFLPVCRAIQHAHQKGIIHRDIKPSNVLVAEYDGRPVAKVIDFGIAKAIDQRLSDESVITGPVFTGLGQIIGTFEYMSPEQSRVNQLDVDTRSDIYSLGVLLYELLTGSPPFDKERLRSVALDEMLQIIREEDPPKPSSRLAEKLAEKITTPSTATPSTAKRDRSESSKLIRVVRGELDWIVLKAMEKDPNRRYGTPNGLANDIVRFLGGEAVEACPPSTIYRFSKFARRNKVMLATSAIVAASLILGLVSTSWQAIRARRAEETSQAVNAFLVDDLFGLADAESQLSAGLSPDPNLKLITLLDRALVKVNRSFSDQPEVKANLQSALASSYSSIGRYDDAASLYRELLDHLQTTHGDQHPATIRAMRQLARTHFDQSQLDLAAPIYAGAYATSREFLGDEHELTLLLLNDRAMLFQKQGRFAESEVAFDDCLKTRRRLLGGTHPDTLGTMSNLATLYQQLDRFDEAEDLHRLVLETRRRVLPRQHPRIADALHNLGSCHLQRGRQDEQAEHFDQSLPLFDEALEINLANAGVRGPDHPATNGIQRDRAQVYLEQERFADAEPILVDLVERLTRLRSAEDVLALRAKSMLGWMYLQQDRPEEAENMLRDVLDFRQAKDPSSVWTIQIRGNLAIAMYQLAKLEQAIAMDLQALPLAENVLGSEHVETVSCLSRLGLSHLELGRPAEGRRFLERAFEAGESLPGAFRLCGELAISYSEDQNFEAALAWTARQIENVQAMPPADEAKRDAILAACELRRQELIAQIDKAR